VIPAGGILNQSPRHYAALKATVRAGITDMELEN
jgi:hypothetical protein